MSAHHHVIPGLLTAKECQKVIKYARRYYPPAQGTVGTPNGQQVDAMRESVLRWLPYDDLDLVWLRLRIERQILLANRDLFGLDLQPSFPDMQFTEYPTGGKYEWHTDSSRTAKRPMGRKLSFVLQLNDPREYDGGQFEIEGDPLPSGTLSCPGDALIFRSGLSHRVTTLTRGTRYSLVVWVSGPVR